MAEQREHVITVLDPTVWDVLWDQLTTNGLGDNFIPHRSVGVVNDRPFNDYSAHFSLTDPEALEIATDPRVHTVELCAALQDDVHKRHSGSRVGDYNRDPALTTSQMKNWGLIRCITTVEPFGQNKSLQQACGYNLDGSDVDIIVVDTGIEANHPEFAVNADGTGGSRVIDFNWASLGVPGIATGLAIGGYLGDSDGHGSNCASIAAGNTQGWAPKAAVYSIRIFNGSDITTGAPLGAINADYVFDLVRAFHLQKIASGNKRPTICTNSWGYSSTYTGMVSTTWRNTSYANTVKDVTYGQVNDDHPYSINYVNAGVNNCINAGVILLVAAGNNSHKIDVPGGVDYDNYYVYQPVAGGPSENVYYHRGSSPMGTDAIIVGAHGYLPSAQVIEGKASFSCSGPRVDIYAPGVLITGAYANQPYATQAAPDPRNPNFYINKISGTSQATPQVAGYLACIAQARPNVTPSQAKAFVLDYSIKGVLNEVTWNYPIGTTYGNYYSLQGGDNRLLYQPFNSAARGGASS